MVDNLTLIAEFCQNHNGDFDTLRIMIDAAAKGGATHAKIQTIFADDLAFRTEFEEGKFAQNGDVITIKRPYKNEYDRLKKLELTYDQQAAFVAACREAGLEPLTTAFTLTCIPHLSELGWNAVKVASYDCGSLPLVRALADQFDHLIISTGATFDEEIDRTAAYLNEVGRAFTMLHCVTLYPTPLGEMHLNRMEYLRQFTNSVGLSDHSLVSTDGIKAALVAIHLGATTIERHFTVFEASETKDGPVSITQKHLEEIVEFANLEHDKQAAFLAANVPEAASMYGLTHRPLSDEEQRNRAYYRGRFANKFDQDTIYNWEDEKLTHHS